MKYTYNNKEYTIPDEAIDNMMEKDEELSLADACELYLYDKELIDNNEAEKLNREASKNRITQTIHDAKQDKRKRKAPTRKENPLKQEIINILFDAIRDNLKSCTAISISNNEKYVDFKVGETSFTVNLIQHREKKS